MVAVGFDLGNYQSTIAFIRNNAVDIVSNEFSNRTTPSLVSFGVLQQFIGELAKAQEISNFNNTVGNLKRLVGRTFSESEVQEIEKFMTVELADVDGQVGVKVNCLGEETTLSSIQILAMYLNRLKEMAAAELNDSISTCVITVPGWFTESQRRAVLDAAKLVDLNCLQLINDLTAVALNYGLTRPGIPSTKPRNVAFVDIGHSGCSVAIVSLVKGNLTVRGTAYEEQVGGQHLDQILVEKLAAELREKINVDIYSDKKALARLRVSAEICKKDLSTHHKARVSIKSIMDGKDVSIVVDRADFERWASPLFSRIEAALQEALENARLTSDIDSVEFVGGCSQIPAIRAIVSKFFDKDVSNMLNWDGPAARGAALQCAIMSHAFKSHHFYVNDICSYPIKFSWAATSEDKKTEIFAFVSNDPVPCTKTITFRRREPFTIQAVYGHPQALPSGINPCIGSYDINNIDTDTDTDKPGRIKLTIGLDVHGILYVKPANVEKAPSIFVGIMSKKTSKKIRRLDQRVNTAVVARSTSVSQNSINKYPEKRFGMTANDMLRKYGNDLRDKVLGPYAAYTDPAVRSKFLDDINAVISWIYDESDNASTSACTDKIASLKRVTTLVVERLFEMGSYLSPNTMFQSTSMLSVKETVDDVQKISYSPDQVHQHSDRSHLAPPPYYSPYSPYHKPVRFRKIRHSLMFPSLQSTKIIETHAWRTGRSPGSVFFDISSCSGHIDAVLKTIKSDYSQIVAVKCHRENHGILAEVNFDESDETSRTKACTVGFTYKGTRILATNALYDTTHIIRLHLTDMPFLRPEKLKRGLVESLSTYGKILDIGTCYPADLGLYTGDGYAVLDRYQLESEQPFAELAHRIPWENSTDRFYAMWNDMPVHCIACHEKGHSRKVCPNRSRAKAGCFICGEKGHVRSTFPVGNMKPNLNFQTTVEESLGSESSDGTIAPVQRR
ncbi:adenyl-nucleotide exchange factor sse1 [Apophysomyces sp. BC1021]|nr:adenyl-nucleotide exchange factor sse1 [Apophysomyces sp. BC1021]